MREVMICRGPLQEAMERKWPFYQTNSITNFAFGLETHLNRIQFQIMHCNARSWSCLREVLWVMICEGQCKKPHSGQGRRVLTSPSKGCWLAQDRFTLLLKSSWVRPRWISIQASWRAQLKISRGSALILRNFGLYFSTVFSNCISQLYFKPAYILTEIWLVTIWWLCWSESRGSV